MILRCMDSLIQVLKCHGSNDNCSDTLEVEVMPWMISAMSKSSRKHHYLKYMLVTKSFNSRNEASRRHTNATIANHASACLY